MYTPAFQNAGVILFFSPYLCPRKRMRQECQGRFRTFFDILIQQSRLPKRSDNSLFNKENMKKTKPWARPAASRQQVSTQKETNVRQPPESAPPPAVTGRTVCLTSRGRSDFARAIFPQLSRKDSGVRVARDIAEVPPLRARMYASGYRPGKRGYTDEQIAILLEFYSLTYKNNKYVTNEN